MTVAFCEIGIGFFLLYLIVDFFSCWSKLFSEYLIGLSLNMLVIFCLIFGFYLKLD